MNQWKQAKSFIYSLFGEKTIIRSKEKIEVTLSQEQRSHQFNKFLYLLDDNGVLTKDFETFLKTNEDGFFENKVLLPYPSYHIPQGAKILKSFKKFLSNRETVKWTQDAASRFIQGNKIKGYLYLSIDPRDFLTLSENNSNWETCQSLDGSFRTGNLSYMVDNSTIIAYLATNKKERFKCLPKDIKWYNKKWRMLIHLNKNENIYYNKQYPYNSSELLDRTHTMLTSLLTTIFSPPMDYGFKVALNQTTGHTMLPFNQINMGGRTYDTRDLINADDYNGFCDLIYSNSYSPIVAVNQCHLHEYQVFCQSKKTNKKQEDSIIDILLAAKVGERPICPCCGEGKIKRANKLLCNKCIDEHNAEEDFFLVCNDCHKRIYNEDKVYFEQDIPYCRTCYKLMKEEN